MEAHFCLAEVHESEKSCAVVRSRPQMFVLGGDGELCGVPLSRFSICDWKRARGGGFLLFAPSCQYFNFYKTRVFIKWEGKRSECMSVC